jgi:hypothetical protein
METWETFRMSRKEMPRPGLVKLALAGQDRGPMLTLLGAIDDATDTVAALYFRPAEDLHGYVALLGQLAARHGLPAGPLWRSSLRLRPSAPRFSAKASDPRTPVLPAPDDTHLTGVSLARPGDAHSAAGRHPSHHFSAPDACLETPA